MPGPFRYAPPVLGRSVLTRPRLLQRLVGRFSQRCTVVTAGAGHGKTTLLVQAVAENRFAPRGDDVWLALEAGDADATTLASDMLVALGAPEAAPDAAAIADAVWRRAPTDVCLVLDDVHVLPSGSTGSGLLTSLLDGLPANGHLLLAARTMPALPLARHAGHGAVTRIEESELRYDEEELATFAAARDIAAAHLARTAGWPAMAELVASAGSDLAGDFLWQEVLEPLDPRRRRIFAVLVDIGGGDDRLLSVALGEPIAFDGTIPLISVDHEGWHQPHALWQTVDGLTLPAAERADVRRRGGRELVARGRLDAAFDLFAGVELWEEVPAILYAACRTGMRPTASLLRTWLARCPEAVVLGPAGQLATGVLAALSAPELAADPLRSAVAAFRAAGDVDGELSAISHYGHVAWWQRDLGALSELAPRVAELAASGNATARGLAAVGGAVVANILGDDAGVLAALDTIEPGALDERWDAVAGWFRGLALLGLGDEDGALEALERALPLADPAFRVTVNATLTAARWAQGRIEMVPAEADSLLAAAEASGIAQDIAAVAATSARACAYVGELDLARSYLVRARKVVAHLTPAAHVHIALAEAAIALGEGEDARAAEVLVAAVAELSPDDGRVRSTWRTDPALTYVLVPGTRAAMDAAVGSHRLGWTRDLVTAVVAAREGSKSRVIDTVDVSEPARVRSVLPFPLATELAVALHDAGRTDDAATLLAAVGDPGRAHARGLGTSAAKSLLAAVPAAPANGIRIVAFGAVRIDGRPIDRLRVRELLGYLLLHRVTARAAVTATLWPDLDDRAAANNLRVTLSHLLRALEPDRAEGEAAYFVRQSAAELRFVVDSAVDLDVDAFDAHVDAAATAEARGTPSVALEHYVAAADLYGGDLLADLPEISWADLERERCRARFVASAVRAGELLVASNGPDRAEPLAHRALAVDEWSEPAYGVLASAALARGDRSGAMRALERCREMLGDLGVEPSQDTARLARRVRASIPASPP